MRQNSTLPQNKKEKYLDGQAQEMALQVFPAIKENHKARETLSGRKRGQKMSMLDPLNKVQHSMMGHTN